LPPHRRGLLASPAAVERTLTCDCGFEARADDDDALVAEIQRHASETHGMELSDDEARALVRRSELRASAAADSAPKEEDS
jgi:predicted small metal-binding protein